MISHYNVFSLADETRNYLELSFYFGFMLQFHSNPFKYVAKQRFRIANKRIFPKNERDFFVNDL